jgi:NADPH:quinone reductase
MVMMLVIEALRFGSPDVLAARQAPEPAAGPGQVVVQTLAADVLFVDAMIRKGLNAEYFQVRPPYVPGNGVAGPVISVGDGVDPGWLGVAVAAHTGGAGGRGGYAEQVVASADDLVAAPDGVTPLEAAALLHDGATAIRLLENMRVKQDEWVLVTAAAGGMGVLLVQLARAAGGRVVGAARGDRKLAVARDAGAEAAVDYSEPHWVSRVLDLTGGHGADVVLDGAGGRLGEAAFGITAQGGRFSAHGAPAGGFARLDPAVAADREITVSGIPQYESGERRRLVTAALRQAAAGRIRPVIGQTFALERAADAHAAMEARATIAKTLLLA